MVAIVLAAVLAVLGFISPGPRLMALPTIGVTIDGGTVTSQLMSASWNIGIDNFLADLSPNTASLSFKGQLSVSPADAVVITAGGTAMWTGRLDTYTETRDVNGDYWSSVTATDLIGALGAATLRNSNGVAGKVDAIAESLATTAGITIDVVDSTSSGLTTLKAFNYFSQTFNGSVLEYINTAARSSNTMLALQRDGTIRAWTREALAVHTLNGTFDVNTTGWAVFNTGTISRNTSDTHAGAGSLQIVSGTNYGGASYAITARFVQGHRYRMRFWAKVTAGSGAWYAATFAYTPDTPTFTPTSSWAEYYVDWTPSATVSSDTLVIRDNDTTTGTLLVDDVEVYEVIQGTDVDTSTVSWTKTTSLDVDINRWVWQNPDGTLVDDESDAADVTAYGERAYRVDDFLDVDTGSGAALDFADWIAYGGSQRSVVTAGELVVTSSTSALLALDPLDWVWDGSQYWQIMFMSWSVTPGEPWRLTITADDLINLL